VRPEHRALAVAKLRAFGAHFALSLAIFVAIIWVCVELWYPAPYFWIDGGWFAVRIAAAVDVIAGPLLTLIIYRPARQWMAANLAVIAFVQAAFLAWGVIVLERERPVITVYIGTPAERFYPVTRELAAHGLRPIEEVQALSAERPPIVAVRLPEDPEKARELLQATLQGRSGVLRRTELFEPLAGEHLKKLLAAGRSRERIAGVWPIGNANLERFLAERGKRFEDYAFIPVHGRYYLALLAFERASGRYAGALYAHDRLPTLYRY
jgi:hypothetical protein